jgi:hypothetical protein
MRQLTAAQTFALHCAAAVSLIVYALTEASYNEYGQFSWIDPSCLLLKGRKFTTEPNNNLYVEPPPEGAWQYNVLSAATVYMLWSAAVNGVEAKWPTMFSPVQFRYIDYCLSAPLMLQVIALLFNVKCAAGALIAPLLLFVALLLAAQIDLKQPDNNSAPSFRDNPPIWLAWVLFVLGWIPMFAALDTGTAPWGVFLLLSILVCLFAVFGMVYHLVDGPRRNGAFRAASAVTKITLHWYIAVLLVFNQKMVKEADEAVNPDDIGTTSIFVAFGGGLVVTFTMLAYLYWPAK